MGYTNRDFTNLTGDMYFREAQLIVSKQKVAELESLIATLNQENENEHTSGNMDSAAVVKVSVYYGSFIYYGWMERVDVLSVENILDFVVW